MLLTAPLQCAPGRARRVLGIDLGLTLGYALVNVAAQSTTPTVETSGSVRVGSRRSEHVHLERLVRDLRPSVVAYEDVRRHNATAAAHVYGGAKAALLRVAAEYELPVVPVPVAHAKQRASGKGNARKGQMVAAAEVYLGVCGEDEADALFVALVGLERAGGT